MAALSFTVTNISPNVIGLSNGTILKPNASTTLTVNDLQLGPAASRPGNRIPGGMGSALVTELEGLLTDGKITVTILGSVYTTSAYITALSQPNTIAPGTTAPSSPTPGSQYFDTDDNLLYTWNGSAWVDYSGLSNATVTIPFTSVRTLNATPYELVAAPGAGYYIEVVSIHWWLDYGTAAYDAASAGDALGARYTNSSGPATVNTVAGNTIGSASADYHIKVEAVDCVPVENAALVAHIAVGEWYAAAGDSPLKAKISYRVKAFTW